MDNVEYISLKTSWDPGIQRAFVKIMNVVPQKIKFGEQNLDAENFEYFITGTPYADRITLYSTSYTCVGDYRQ